MKATAPDPKSLRDRARSLVQEAEKIERRSAASKEAARVAREKAANEKSRVEWGKYEQRLRDQLVGRTIAGFEYDGEREGLVTLTLDDGTVLQFSATGDDMARVNFSIDRRSV